MPAFFINVRFQFLSVSLSNACCSNIPFHFNTMNISDDEYGSFYAGYINLSRGVPLEPQLQNQADEILAILTSLSNEDALYRYAEGKWTLKEVFGHLIDTERIFGYRAVCIARGEPNALPGYDQDLYVNNARFNEFPIDKIEKSYLAVRQSTLELFSEFNGDELLRRGTVNESSCTVRALGYIIAGHEHHHLNILAEKYLPGLYE